MGIKDDEFRSLRMVVLQDLWLGVYSTKVWWWTYGYGWKSV